MPTKTKFFSRITRYDMRARENRLTEITAATLERVDGLTSRFASFVSGGTCPRWVANGEAHRVEISTQVPMRGRFRSGFADLVLEFATDAEPLPRRYVLIVEVKHGAPESGDQIDVYEQHLRDHVAAESALVILAPRNFVENTRSAKSSAPHVSYWQDLAADVQQHLKRHPPTTNSWLLAEYLDYLKDEGLMEPDRIDVQTALFMQLYPDAIDSVLRLDELVVERVQQQWGDADRSSSHATKRGPGTYHSFPFKPASAVSGWLELTFRDDRSLDLSRGSLVYLAGPSWKKSDPQPSEEWFGVLSQHGFQQFVLDGYQRCMRALYPEDLVAYASLSEQADAVAGWAEETFRLASEASA